MMEELKFVLIMHGAVYVLPVDGTGKQLKLFVIKLEITLVYLKYATQSWHKILFYS